MQPQYGDTRHVTCSDHLNVRHGQGNVKGRDTPYVSRLGRYFSVITAPERLEEPSVRITALTPCFKH